MKNTENLPPYVAQHDCVILFDGVCKLCNAWSNFIIKYDVKKKFKLASVQSDEGKAILKHFGYPIDFYETMLVVEGDGPHCFEKSDAFFAVVKKLNFPWKFLMVFKVIPLPLRDWLYSRIALNRYKLFGKFDYCALPTPDHEDRYLSNTRTSTQLKTTSGHPTSTATSQQQHPRDIPASTGHPRDIQRRQHSEDNTAKTTSGHPTSTATSQQQHPRDIPASTGHPRDIQRKHEGINTK
jgi:predicted DCC family thiol-disulfide oxidoreductase YuxK